MTLSQCENSVQASCGMSNMTGNIFGYWNWIFDFGKKIKQEKTKKKATHGTKVHS